LRWQRVPLQDLCFLFLSGGQSFCDKSKTYQRLATATNTDLHHHSLLIFLTTRFFSGHFGIAKPSGTTTILTWIEERSAERHDRRSGWSQENKAEAASSSRSRRARQTTAGSCDQSIFNPHDHLPAEALLIHGSTTRRLVEGVALWFP
ncbi:hypothetical protein XENOCAPTIV_023851, partial [Xenoophorus captivus]